MSGHAALSLNDAQLPELLVDSISSFVTRFAPSLLTQGREALTSRYRPLAHTHTAKVATQSQVNQLTAVEQAAYLLTRLPATFAVLKAVLHQAIQTQPQLCSDVASVLDLGAGPGTTLWAISEILPHVSKVTNIEQNLSWIQIGKELTRKGTKALLREAVWQQMNLRLSPNLPHADLIVCSYMLGELPHDVLQAVLSKAWEACNKLLLLVEPGTPAGFERIRSARIHLIQQGAHILAPCPHADTCPMTGSNWCHFGQKVLRSGLHRTLKSAALSYEEEKYSYLLVSKTKVTVPGARVLRPPRKRAKHVHLTLCTKEGLKEPILSARNPELYQLAKDVQWGDSLPDPLTPNQKN